MKKNLVVLSGSGISAESGLRTFRDNGGLWENHRVEEVATPQAFQRNPEMVLRFYNQRRVQLGEVSPNRAHQILAELEAHFQVNIVTQNVDDLHERVGSKNILHLHGELRKVRSTKDPNYIKDIGYTELHLGDPCPQGGQLRPHIVWFGEDVPLIPQAAEIVSNADILVIVGTSLQVYPAAGLVNYAPKGIPIFLIDPSENLLGNNKLNVQHFQTTATQGMELLKATLLDKFV